MTGPTPELSSMMEYIGTHFPFTQERYPNADLSTPEKKLAFAVRHSSAHMSKTGGRIAAQVERYDHGGTMDRENLEVETAKMLVNALNLARELGMSAETLASMVSKVMKIG